MKQGRSNGIWPINTTVLHLSWSNYLIILFRSKLTGRLSLNRRAHRHSGALHSWVMPTLSLPYERVTKIRLLALECMDDFYLSFRLAVELVPIACVIHVMVMGFVSQFRFSDMGLCCCSMTQLAEAKGFWSLGIRTFIYIQSSRVFCIDSITISHTRVLCLPSLWFRLVVARRLCGDIDIMLAQALTSVLRFLRSWAHLFG